MTPKEKSDKDCGAIFDPIEQNNINKTKNDSFPETDNRLPILSTMLQRCTYPNKYHVKNFKHMKYSNNDTVFAASQKCL